MIIVRPPRNGSPSVTPRHMEMPFQMGGPSWGWSWARTAERMPSAPTMTSATTTSASPVARLRRWARTTSPALVEPLEGEPGPHRFGAQPLPDRVEQHHLEMAPVDGVLRPAVARALAPRFAPDQAPEAVVVGEGRGRDAGGRQPVGQPQLGQLPHRVGQEVDAHPEGQELAAALDDNRSDAGRVQGEGGGEAADPGPDDEDPEAVAGRVLHATRATGSTGNSSWTTMSGRPPLMMA